MLGRVPRTLADVRNLTGMQLASSQALPALKVALDDECSFPEPVVVNSNMSRGKCLAREGPGSRLGCSSRAVFSSVLSLVAFWQNRSRDQPEPAPERGTDQQNRRPNAELEQHSTAGHVCLRGNLPNICCLLKQRFNRRQASRHCQSAVDMNPERPD